MAKITPRSRKSWRTWLEKNHAAKSEVWLVFYKKGSGRPTLSYDDAVEEALCFGWIDGIIKSIDEQRYMHRFSPRKPNSKWSELNKKRVARMVEAGQMTSAGLRLVEEAKRNGNWKESARPNLDLSVPPEFATRLKRNEKAALFFESLSPSQRKYYIAWIASAKRPETRKRRLDEAMELLKRGEKLGLR